MVFVLHVKPRVSESLINMSHRVHLECEAIALYAFTVQALTTVGHLVSKAGAEQLMLIPSELRCLSVSL